MVKAIHLVLFCFVILGASSAPPAPKDATDGTPRVPSEETSSPHGAYPTTSPDIETEDARNGEISHAGSSDASKPRESESTVTDLTESPAVHLESSSKKHPVPKKFKGKESQIEDKVTDLTESPAVHLEFSPKKQSVAKILKSKGSEIEDKVADLRDSPAVHLEITPKKQPVPKTFKGLESQIREKIADTRESSAVLLETSPKEEPFPKKIKGTESETRDATGDWKESSAVHLGSYSKKEVPPKYIKKTASPSEGKALILEESSDIHLDSSPDNAGAVTLLEQSDHPETTLETDKQEKPIKVDKSVKKKPAAVIKKFTNHKKENSKQTESETEPRIADASYGPDSETSTVKLSSEKPPLSQLQNDYSNKEEPTEKSKMVNIQVNNNNRYKNYRYDPETGNFIEDGESVATEGAEQEIIHVQQNIDDYFEDDEHHTSQKENLKAVREELKKIKSQFGGSFPQLFKSSLSDNGGKAFVKVQVNKNGVSKNYIYSPGKEKVIKFGQFDKSAKYKGDPKGVVKIQYEK